MIDAAKECASDEGIGLESFVRTPAAKVHVVVPVETTAGWRESELRQGLSIEMADEAPDKFSPGFQSGAARRIFIDYLRNDTPRQRGALFHPFGRAAGGDAVRWTAETGARPLRLHADDGARTDPAPGSTGARCSSSTTVPTCGG